ncbi:MAG TPA: hypothetical protein VMO47_14445, partial [Rhodothermales bacterium]|nr:hypothetical protein [Rhodothermales bacterium]
RKDEEEQGQKKGRMPLLAPAPVYFLMHGRGYVTIMPGGILPTAFNVYTPQPHIRTKDDSAN